VTPDPLAAVVHNRPPTTTGLPAKRLRVLDSEVGEARRFLSRVLGGLVPAGHLDDLEMCVSELVTNALRAALAHAEACGFGWSYSDTPIHLSVATAERWSRLSVRDPNPAMLETVPGGLLDEGGRGLVIVDAIAACRWHTTTAHDKTVHAIVPMPLVKLTVPEIVEIKTAVR
jgi:anti-sigma regulatory factor (Ser/Thr protein kinase)